MNSLLVLWAESPVIVSWCKWTLLLAAAAGADAILRRHPPRLRQLLWRGVLLGSAMFVFTHQIPIPGPRIAVLPPPSQSLLRVIEPPGDGTDNGSLPTVSFHESPEPNDSDPAAASAISPNRHSTLDPSTGAAAWHWLLTLGWAAGFLFFAGRLISGHLGLHRLLRSARPASVRAQEIFNNLQDGWGHSRDLRLMEIPENVSPFACGIVRPQIVLPKCLAGTLCETDLKVLLSHELAHGRRRDPLWYSAWRWMAAVAWFHPLAWYAARSHHLACELEADRAAADATQSWSSYRVALSRLVLGLLPSTRPESIAASHATSQLGRRLDFLERARPIPWSRPRCVLAGILFATAVWITAGCQPTSRSLSADSRAFATAEVRVVDEKGLPVAGAKVQPFALRVRGDEASAYGWDPGRFGPKDPVTTAADGVARVPYPVVAMPEERFATVKLLLTVDHPDFSRAVSQGYPVDGTADPIRLRRGAQLRVAGYFREPNQTVRAILPLLSAECTSCNDWITNADGSRSITGLVPGPHLLSLAGQLPEGTIVHSEPREIQLEVGLELHLNLELKPGARLEGRLDARVPRPVRNGRVLIASRPPQMPALVVPEDLGVLGEKYGEIARWQAWRPINEDGSFVFESLPFGEVDVIALGDGFASAPGGTPRNRNLHGTLIDTNPIGVPQSFAVNAPVTRIEVATEPTARLEIRLRTRAGEPVANAAISTYPNVLRFPGGIFGEMSHPSEVAFGPAQPLEMPDFARRTDRDGHVVFENLPSCVRGLDVIHPSLVVPLSGEHRDRWVRFSLTPGNTTLLDLTLIPKGIDFAGAK